MEGGGFAVHNMAELYFLDELLMSIWLGLSSEIGIRRAPFFTVTAQLLPPRNTIHFLLP